MAIELRIYSQLKDEVIPQEGIQGNYKRYNGGTWFAEITQPTETSEISIHCFEVIDTFLIKDNVNICELVRQLPEDWMENPIQNDAKSLPWKSMNRNNDFSEEILGSMRLLRLSETVLLEKKQQELSQYVSDSDIEKIVQKVSEAKLLFLSQQSSQQPPPLHELPPQLPSQQPPRLVRRSSQPLSSQPPLPSSNRPLKTQGEYFQRHQKSSLYSREPPSSTRPVVHHSSQHFQRSQRFSQGHCQRPPRQNQAVCQSHPRQVGPQLENHPAIVSQPVPPSSQPPLPSSQPVPPSSQPVPPVSPPPLPSQEEVQTLQGNPVEEVQMQQDKPARKAPPHISGRLMEPLLLDSF